MALNVYFYHLEKAVNSTATPGIMGVEPSQIETCVLKETTSVVSPVLEISLPETTQLPYTANYVQITNFGRYYFIRDWRNLSRTRWEAVLESDVCATYRTLILGSTQFVERAEKAWDSTIVDGLCLGLGTYTSNSQSFTAPWAIDVGGVYIVEILGGGTSSYYQFSASQLTNFFSELFSDNYADSVMTGWQELAPDLKANLNPLQFIGSVRVFPLAPPGANVGEIPVGWGTVNASGQAMRDFDDEWSVQIGFPAHPHGGDFPFANYVYSEYGLYVPVFGDFPVDGKSARTGVTCDVKYSIKSGAGKCVLKSGGRVVGSANAQIAAGVGISTAYSQGFGAANMVDTIVSAATSALSGNFRGVYEAFSGTLDDMVGAHTAKVRASGNNGDVVEPENRCIAYGLFQAFKAPSSHFVGRPHYKSVELSTLSGGFVQCINATMDGVGTLDEVQKLEGIMEGGIYLE